MQTFIAAAALAVATNLPTVVVEATRQGLPETDAPSSVRVISAAAVKASGCKNAADLLRRTVPSLHVSGLGAGNPALAQVSMRGYGENGFGRTLVLVDGEKLNAPDLTAPNLGRIALGGVSRIEVLGGSQCVQHGDGASAGVINVVTEPEDFGKHGYAEIHGGDYGRIGFATGTRGGFEEEGVKYWADLSYDHSDGYRRNSGYDLWNLIGGVKKEWESGTSLKVTAFYSDSDYRTPGALSWREWKADRQATDRPDDWYWRATYGFGTVFNAQLDDENVLKLTGNFSSRHMTAHAENAAWDYVSHNLHDVYSFRGAAEWINTAELFGFENRFNLGLEYRYDRLDGTYDSSSSGHPTRENPFYDRASMDFFAQDSFRLAEWLALEAGGRYSRVWAYNSLCTTRSRNDNLNAFDVALVANPDDDAKVYLKWSRFFRNAALDEVPWGLNPATLGYVRRGVLKPESGHTAELGFNWKAAEELKFGGDVYATFLEDEIFYDAPNGKNVNSPDATFRRGAELFASWERARTAGVSVGANWTKATFDGGEYGHNLIPMVPSATVSANGRVWLWDDCWIFGGYRYQTWMYSVSDFGNDFRKIDGYGIFHVGATYEPTVWAVLRGFSFSVTVDNLLDADYCDYATYGANWYPAAGRTLMFTVRYEF